MAERQARSESNGWINWPGNPVALVDSLLKIQLKILLKIPLKILLKIQLRFAGSARTGGLRCPLPARC